MRSEHAVDEALVTAATPADDAVGVISRHWYIAIVGNRSERKCSERLTSLGYENYVPIQQIKHTPKTGKTQMKNKVVLPSLVFIHITEQDRRKKVAYLPFIYRFMTDSARRGQAGPPVAVVPDEQMMAFRRMVEHSELPVEIGPAELKFGDPVRVIRGRLSGMEGVVKRNTDGKSRLCISLDILGCAFVEIDKSFLEPITN